MADPASPAPSRDAASSVQAIRDRLHARAGEIRTLDDWTVLMHAAARMPGEKLFANLLLITGDRPAATMMRTYSGWKQAGRHVTRQQPATTLLSLPPPASGKHRPARDPGPPPPDWRDAGRTTAVWDITQTAGAPVTSTEPVPAPGGQATPQLWDALTWVARRAGYAVEREYGCPSDGSTMWSAHRIRISPATTGNDAAWALAHQLGHILLPHAGDKPPPGSTTAVCTGLRKAEADSVAWIICARYGITPARDLPHPASWAGRDPRAQPGAAILAAGQRIISAAAPVITHLDQALPARRIRYGRPPAAGPARSGPPQSRDAASQQRPPDRRPQPPRPSADLQLLAQITAALTDAHAFYTRRLAGSWVPAYLHERGIDSTATADWGLGYAPGGWTALTDHLRAAGHTDAVLQAAGLAKPSRRGTLIDHFRDRVIFPVHTPGGALAGFIGRAAPGAPQEVPKYLNSPETALYRKSELLFGLHHARPGLARGATPALVEGPADVIAVSLADPGRYAGLAPCGTSLTRQHAAVLAAAADLPRTGILVAFDNDPAGRRAAGRAWEIFRPLTGNLQHLARLPGKDPGEVLQRSGPAALRDVLRDSREPLSALIIDTRIDAWEKRLGDIDGPLLAMRSTAALIAELLPDGVAGQVRQVTAGRELQAEDDELQPLIPPELPDIAAILPADTKYQVTRTATRLGFGVTHVLAEVANAATRAAQAPKAAGGQPRRETAPGLRASKSFPGPPVTSLPEQATTRTWSAPASARSARRAR
jgi:DNA primase